MKLKVVNGKVVEIEMTPEEFVEVAPFSQKLGFSMQRAELPKRPKRKRRKRRKRRKGRNLIRKLNRKFLMYSDRGGIIRTWSPEDERYLLENYPIAGLRESEPEAIEKLKEMCEHLHRTPIAIRHRWYLLHKPQ